MLALLLAVSVCAAAPAGAIETAGFGITPAGADASRTSLHERVRAGAAVRGAEADDAARAVIAGRGFGPYFTHRTGHSIDARALHGSGPHMDNYETREERALLPGVGFSVEPGVYVPAGGGRPAVGARSEVNAFIGDGEGIITPSEIQRDLIVV